MMSSSSSRIMLKLYGVPLSQPTRSVAWALLLKQTPFQFVLTVPGLSKPGLGARHEGFRTKTRARSITVPLLEDHADDIDNDTNDNGVLAITESAAILQYLCERRPGWNDLYGAPGTARKATIDSYLHWHHTNTRMLGRITSGYLQQHTPRVEQESKEMAKILKRLETGWLSSSTSFSSSQQSSSEVDNHTYIAGGDGPTIADLMCYEEIIQITALGLLPESQLAKDYPDVHNWTLRMKALPYHDKVHTALTTLGPIVHVDEEEQPQDTAASASVPLAKRLSRATKAGIAAIEEAVQSFSSPVTDTSTTTPHQSKL